jgi:hypothetical protein
VVGYGCYRIVGDNLAHNSQETILMVGTADSVVKTMKQKLQVDNILPYCYDVFVSSVFIELFESSSSEDSTPFIDGITTKHSLVYCLFVIRAIHPYGEYSIYCLKCLHVMVLLGQTLNELQTLDYDKIPL